MKVKEQVIGYEEKGKKEFGFVYKKELIVYKNMLGFRLSRDEKKYIKQYKKDYLETEGKPIHWSEKYTDWKQSIEEKYQEYDKEKLADFIFYLKNGRDKDLVLSEGVIGIALPMIMGVVLVYIEDCINLIQLDVGKIIGILIIFYVCFWNGLNLFVRYSDGKKLYEEYGNIIEGIYNRK